MLAIVLFRMSTRCSPNMLPCCKEILVCVDVEVFASKNPSEGNIICGSSPDDIGNLSLASPPRSRRAPDIVKNVIGKRIDAAAAQVGERSLWLFYNLLYHHVFIQFHTACTLEIGFISFSDQDFGYNCISGVKEIRKARQPP